MQLTIEINEGVWKSKEKIPSVSVDDKNDSKNDDGNTEKENNRTLDIGDHQTQPEKPQHEQKTGARQQREMDFQEELNRITEAEKLQQTELELRKRNTQEKLEQELLLRQELIGDFKKQVEQERVMIEKEKRRTKMEQESQIKEKTERRKSEKRKKEEMREKEAEEKDKNKDEITEREDVRENKWVQFGRHKMRELVGKNEEEKKEVKEGVKREEEETKRREEKRWSMVTENMVMMGGEEQKKNKKPSEELKVVEKNEDKETRRDKDSMIGSHIKVRVNYNEVMREESGWKTSENEMQNKEWEEERKIGKRGDLCLGKKCLLRNRDEKRQDNEMEGQGWRESETVIQEKEENERNAKDEKTVKEERKGSIKYEREQRETEHLGKTDNDERQEELKDLGCRTKDSGTNGAEDDEMKADKEEQIEVLEKGEEEGRGAMKRKKEAKKLVELIDRNDPNKKKKENDSAESPQNSDKTEHWTPLVSVPSLIEATTSLSICETSQHHCPGRNMADASTDALDSESKQSTPIPASLHEYTEQKMLYWKEYCTPWSKLSLQNKKKQKGCVQSQRRPRRAAGVSSLPPLYPKTLLESTGRRSLQEVTTATLEDLPACSLSTIAQCNRLQSLTLRRCGLQSVEGISQLQQLCYVDLRENDISFLDCENMSSLRVLRLAHNKLTSIHGLRGADSLDFLDLSHNSITRIAGLESARRLQRLSVDHNQLISTKGLREVYTLLHLDCSHNHLTKVEGLENSALLHTLDLRSNNLTEAPSLNNQVLLRELLLDDNNVSSLHGLAACWLPLLEHLAVSQNRITQLPSMIDLVSLKNLDLSFNCLAELQNVCENVEGCLFLQEVHLTGNPLQQERDWRSKLQKAVPGLRADDGQQTDSFLSPLASRQLSLAPHSFLTLCQKQLKQTQDLQQRLSREVGNASLSLDAVKSCCHYFTLALQLAEDQRFAHEHDVTAMSAEHMDEGQTTSEKTLHMSRSLGKLTDSLKTESAFRRPPDNLSREKDGHIHYHSEDKPNENSRQETFGGVKTGQRSITKSNFTKGFTLFLSSKEEQTSNSLDEELDKLHSKNTAAIVLQRMWRKYKQKCRRAKASLIADSEGENKLSVANRSTSAEEHAAIIIQAFWRGFALRRRLASALTAFTGAETGEEDAFEEVDVQEFVVEEQALEKHWTLTFSDDLPPMDYPVTELHLPPQSQVVLQPKQAWVAEEQPDFMAERCSAETPSISRSSVSTLVHSDLSERSEKIIQEWGFTNSRTALLMLKRAEKMKATKHKQKKLGNPSVRVAFRDSNYRISPAEARNRPTQYSRLCLKVGEAQIGHPQAERTERMRRQQAEEELKAPAASQRGPHLPQINSTGLSRGRVQLLADLSSGDHSSAAGLCVTAQLSKVNTYPCRSNSTHATKEAVPLKQVTSPVGKKEHISFNPVQLDGGWGGGKKRERLQKVSGPPKK
ncbi:leucine-rich repeat and IQ domain-containing protein 1 [Cyprinodon tularosa]|uniref:leucine-rich repeat and IQ domain-containing protein 1 n=1 Tax=Cyprinodon tularosa TaxID=77115 RepID=UPI0018E25FA1|nr:leucine-rich repeat and IQ domain-containing protein 1 [Cyprinodon tularosa]